MVKATKRSLRYLPTSSLTLLVFDAALKNIASTINNWPQIAWSVNPPDAPHRLGGAEIMVKATKIYLRYPPTSSLTLLEFDAALKNIASTINNWPLGFNTNEDEVLTPNQLLLGRNFDPIHPPDLVLETNITVLLPHIREIVSSWSSPNYSRSLNGRCVIWTLRRGICVFCTKRRGSVGFNLTNNVGS